MCFSKRLSLISFIFGLFSSFSLWRLGLPQWDRENKVLASFFAYVALMQLVDYFLWSDPECVTGINRAASNAGAVLNYMQPVVLLLIALSCDLPARSDLLLNMVCVAVLVYTVDFACSKIRWWGKCSKVKQGHMSWSWVAHLNYWYYHALMCAVCILFSNVYMFPSSLLLSYLLFFISFTRFPRHIGELWCLAVTGLPFVMLIGQHIAHI